MAAGLSAKQCAAMDALQAARVAGVVKVFASEFPHSLQYLRTVYSRGPRFTQIAKNY